MKNLKISGKLTIGFGVVIIMLIVLGFSAFVGLRNLNLVINQYSEKTLPNTKYIWQMQRDLVSVERFLTQAIASTDYNQVQNLIQKAKSEYQALSDSIEAYRANMRTDPALLKEFEDILSQGAGYRDQIYNILGKEQTPENAASAYLIFDNNYLPILDKAIESINKISDAVDELATHQKDDANSQMYFSKNLVFFILVIGVIFAIIIGLLIRKSILVPVKEIENVAKEMSMGNLGSQLNYQSKDELGVMAESLRQALSMLKMYIDDIAYAMGEFANNSFVLTKPKESFVGDFQVIEASINKVTRNMTDTLSQIRIAADQVSSGSEQVSFGAQALAQGATEQASSIEELSASINEISNQVKQNARNSSRANDMSGQAADAIQASNHQMELLTTAMNEINVKSSEIRKIIKTIEDIAFQTNILALNAAVEAARAGEAGKGFAVVADEVRNLAGRSADAAKNTTALIEDSVHAINNGVGLTNATAEDMVNAVNLVRETTALIADITEASQEQSGSISQVTLGIDQISSVVQTNSATSQESAAASEELSGQASLLKELVGKFRLE